MSRRSSLHHLYYSSHAEASSPDTPATPDTPDTPATMLRANNLRSKSSYNLDQPPQPLATTASSKQFGSR